MRTGRTPSQLHSFTYELPSDSRKAGEASGQERIFALADSRKRRQLPEFQFSIAKNISVSCPS